MRFTDYKVAITGATSGIGLAAAKMFLDEGATVIGIGRSFERTKDLGAKFIPFKADVRRPEEIKAAVDFVDATFGGELDTFLHVAGLGQDGTLTDFTPEQFDNASALLLRAGALFGEHLYPLLQKAPKGNASIVNVASAASRSISPNIFLYELNKQAMVNYSKHAALAFQGVRVNSVSPGYIDTPIFLREGGGLTDNTLKPTFDGVAAMIPCHRIGTPEEVADLIAFITSDEAGFITGADFLIDGGLTAV